MSERRPRRVVKGTMRTWTSAAATWSLVFALMHFFWVFAYFVWPAAGLAMLGPMFEQAFASARFRAYDLVVGVLFVATGLMALAMGRRSFVGRATFLRRSLWVAAVILSARGAAGTLLDTAIILGGVPGNISRLMLYDLWFVIGGALFYGALHQQRREVRSVGT